MQVPRVTAFVLAGVAAATGLGSVRAGDPAPFRLEERLGADVIAFASLDGFPTGWRAALGTTPLGALLRDRGFDEAIRPAFDLARRAIARAGASESMCAHFAAALEGLDGQLAVAVTGVSRDGAPGVVVSLDFGAKLSELREFTSRVLRTPPEPGAFTADVIESKTGVLALFDAGDVRWEAATFGTTVVLDNLDRWSRAKGPPATLDSVPDALAKVPAFLEARGAFTPGAVGCFAYANLASLVSRELDSRDGGWSKAFVHAAGFDALTTLSYRAAVEPGGIVEALRLGASKAESGIFSLFRTQPIRGTTSLPEPRRTWCHLETSLPVSTWPSRWRTFVHGIDADDERDLVAGIARLDHVMGAALEGEVLAALVDEQTWSIGPSDGGGAFPDVVLSIPLRRPSTFEPMFERAVTGLCADLSERGDVRFTHRALAAGARTMHVIESKSASASPPPPFSPTWAVVEGRLAVTLVPHTMRALLRRVDRSAGSGSAAVGSGPDLIAARAAGGACVVATRDLLPRAYDTLVPLAQALPSWKDALHAVDLDALRLPATEAAEGAASDTVIALRLGEEGASLDATSPTGVVPTALALVAIVRAARAFEAADPDERPPAHMTAFAAGASEDPVDATGRAIERTIKLIREYQALRGSFPASLDDVVLTERLAPKIPVDGWHHPLGYDPAAGSRPPRVVSAGPDGVPGTDDDVAVDVESAPK